MRNGCAAPSATAASGRPFSRPAHQFRRRRRRRPEVAYTMAYSHEPRAWLSTAHHGWTQNHVSCNVPITWSRSAAANLPLPTVAEAQLLPWPAPEDGCAYSHRSDAMDPGRPSSPATPLRSRPSEERASSIPAPRSAALSTPAEPAGRGSRFGHSSVEPARVLFKIIGNGHQMGAAAVSDAGGAPTKPVPDRPTVRGTDRGVRHRTGGRSGT